MTISSTTRKAGPFQGNDVTTSFPFEFKVFEESNLEVIHKSADGTELVLTLDSDYAVTLNEDQDEEPGGSISYPLSGDPLPEGATLTVIGVLPELQETDIQNGGGFFPRIIEDRLDYLTILIQQHAEKLARAVLAGASDDEPNLSIQTAAIRAGKILGFDEDGNLELLASIGATTISQSILRALLWPQTSGEASADVTPSSYAPNRPWVDAVDRYELVGDGTTDNTNAFTRMFSVAGQALFIRRGDYVTGRFFLPANTTLYLEPGTIIRDNGNLIDGPFCVIEEGANNVHIIGWGAKILMDRDDYTTGEQRHGLSIRGTVENVCVEGLESSDTGGDGFYIGGKTDSDGVPTNIRLVGCYADNNRRQGFSLTCGRRVRIIDCKFTNTNGTNPQAGVDIEPDSADEVLSDIVLRNVRTEGNEGAGIEVHLASLDSTSEPVSIDIYNHTDVGSRQGFRASAARLGAKGHLRIHQPVWRDNGQLGFFATSWCAGGVLCEVFDPIVEDCNQLDAVASELAGAAYAVGRESSSSLSDPVGGVRIYRPAVRATDTQLPLVAFYFVNSSQAGEIEDVRVIDPVEIVYSTAATNWQGGAEVYFRDAFGVLRNDQGLSRDAGQTRFYSIESNSGASGAINIDLTDWTVTGTERTFEVVAAQTLRVRANIHNAANRIFPGSYTSLESNEPGARLTLKKGSGGYYITQMVGVWHDASSTIFSISNEVADYTFDADTVTTAELADIVASLIKKLRVGT